MFRRLRTRIIVFWVAVLGLVQVTAFVLVNAANDTNAQEKIEAELQTGERVFARLLEQNRERLVQAARVLAADFAFREAVATGDVDTVGSALRNHGARIDSDMAMLLSLDGQVIADTLSSDTQGKPFAFPALLSAAQQDVTSSSIELLDRRAYQFVVVPVLAPRPIAWVVLGFVVDDSLARDLRQLTALDVSFFAHDAGGASFVLASTLGRERAIALAGRLGASSQTGTALRIVEGDDEQQIKLISIQRHGDEAITAVLQRSVSQATAVFRNLRNTLMGIAIASLLLSILASALIALNITRPLSALADSATRIRAGDYDTPVSVERRDEIGTLAESLDAMRSGIAGREREILRLAYEDTLTGLANRALFNKWLTEAIERADTQPITVLVMNLDRFKSVNDTLGYEAGDHVLREVAYRLGRVTGSGVVARLGGDEFAFLLDRESSGQAARLAEEIAHALELPIPYGEQWLDVGASMGVAEFPGHGRDASTLLRRADIAMSVAKRFKSGYALYDPQYDTHQQKYLSLLGELRRAVELNELRLFYQPKMNLSNNGVSEVEALLRWQHPERGFIPAGDFIPFAEHTGHIKALTQWVLQEAARQCGVWLKRGTPLRVSVNLSTRDLLNRELPSMLLELVSKHEIEPQLLCLEITESGFMEDPAHARSVLEHLHKLGFHLAIDDYGTGYSSLSYIAQLPVDELKIDRSFVAPIVKDATTATIVRSTIELGHNLGLKVVAEGVEDGEGLRKLYELGCDIAQGYHISKPLPADKLEEWLQTTGRCIAPRLSDASADAVKVA
jgi:diguanylate cyclase (GGDEF)-like protein